MESDLLATICVSSGRDNAQRRRACRNTWFRYVTSDDSPLDAARRARLRLHFLVAAPAAAGSDGGSSGGAQRAQHARPAAGQGQQQLEAGQAQCVQQLAAEQAQHGDLMLVDAAEGYQHLWRKALVALRELEGRGVSCAYFVHADDDSLLRLDLLVPLLEAAPRERHYWGYIWDGTGNRMTAPIRNPNNKSHMPEEQYPYDSYPPFASGCGFVLSWDLVRALLAQPLPDYRLLDPPFGIHLCGGPRCVLGAPVVPVHDDRVRPYRGIPVFHPATLVQHYLRPEEMKPFYDQALEHARQQQQQQQQQQQEQQQAGASPSAGPTVSAPTAAVADGGCGDGGSGDEPGAGAAAAPQAGASGGCTDGGGGGGAAAELYAQLVALGLLRR
ncbi:MAG: galactosyltransferase-domain-containing protein [Monoraphidium minutum]|nr:MAG: galactosyltransferase-domain-containing protein [Monoraphidium minutum]